MFESRGEEVQVQMMVLKGGGDNGSVGENEEKKGGKRRWRKKRLLTADLAVVLAKASIEATLGHIRRGTRPGQTQLREHFGEKNVA